MGAPLFDALYHVLPWDHILGILKYAELSGRHLALTKFSLGTSSFYAVVSRMDDGFSDYVPEVAAYSEAGDEATTSARPFKPAVKITLAQASAPAIRLSFMTDFDSSSVDPDAVAAFLMSGIARSGCRRLIPRPEWRLFDFFPEADGFELFFGAAYDSPPCTGTNPGIILTLADQEHRGKVEERFLACCARHPEFTPRAATFPDQIRESSGDGAIMVAPLLEFCAEDTVLELAQHGACLL